MKTILNNHVLKWTTVEFGRKDIRSILLLLLILFFSANCGEGQQKTDFPSDIELEQEFNKGFIRFPGSSRGAQDKLDQAWRYFEKGQYDRAQGMVQLRARRSRKLIEEYAFLEARIKYELAEYEDDPVARDREFRVASSLFLVLLFDSPKSDRVVEVAYWQAKSEYKRSEYEKTVWLLNNPDGSFRDRADKYDNDSVKIDGVLLLSESYLGMLDPVNARYALLELDAFTVKDPLQAWSRLYINFKAQLMENRFKEVLENIGDLYDLVELVTEPSYKTMTLDIHGRILESLNRENEAVKVYKEILYSEETAEILVRRENLEHIIQLLNRDDQLPGLVKAIEFVVDFNRNFSSDGTQDLADLNLAELYLLRSSRLEDVSEEARPSNKAAYLHQASIYADRAIDRWPQHPVIGRAFIVRGWGKWESEDFNASRAAFQVALDWFSRSKTMKRSVYEAEARYKYADCHLVQRNYSQAVENYNKLLQDYQEVEYAPVKARFFASAIQHLIEAQLGLGDANAALLLKDRLVREFPNSEHTASALIRMGTELRWLQRPSESRAILDQFLNMLPDHNSVSDVLMTRARTFMDEANWTAAFRVLNRWKSEYSDSPDLPLVQFEIAWIMARSGEESAAFLLFEEFLKENNNHALVATAKEWITSHSFNPEQNRETAILNEELFNSDGLDPNQRFFQTLMAARSAAGKYTEVAFIKARSILNNLMKNVSQMESGNSEKLNQIYLDYGSLLRKQAVFILQHADDDKSAEVTNKGDTSGWHWMTSSDGSELVRGCRELMEYSYILANAESDQAKALHQEILAFTEKCLTHFENTYSDSPARGEAKFIMGWYFFWLQLYEEALSEFLTAAQFSHDQDQQMMIDMKCGDCCFQLKKFREALEFYRNAFNVVTGSEPLSESSLSVIEAVGYQILLSLIMTDQLEMAVAHLHSWSDRIQKRETASLTSVGSYMLGREFRRQSMPEEARLVFYEALDKTTLPEINQEFERQIARTFGDERNWNQVIRRLQEWKTRYPDSRILSEVSYDLAWYRFQSEGEDALEKFQHFLLDYPDSVMSLSAGMWIGNSHFQNRNYQKAEEMFKDLCAEPETTFPDAIEACMMAGRSAFAQRDFEKARAHFQKIVLWVEKQPDFEKDTELFLFRSRAVFAIGDTWMQDSEVQRNTGSDNLVSGQEIRQRDRFLQALEHFVAVAESESNLTLLAWGRAGDCYHQLGYSIPERIDDAKNAYRVLIDIPGGMIPEIRFQAKIGYANILFEEALLLENDHQKQEQVNKALQIYMSILDSNPTESLSDRALFWAKRAGFTALKAAEKAGSQAMLDSICRELILRIPELTNYLQTKMSEPAILN